MALSQEKLEALLLAQLPKSQRKPAKSKSINTKIREYEGPFIQRNIFFFTRYIQNDACKENGCNKDSNVRIVGVPYCIDHLAKHMNECLEAMRLPLKVTQEQDNVLL